VPDAILNRPKMGFPVPFSNWMRAGWNQVARDVLLDRRSRERGIIDPPAVDSLLRRHAAGADDEGDRIWSLLNLELWYRTFVDREGVQTLPEPPRRRSQPRLDDPSTAAAGEAEGRSPSSVASERASEPRERSAPAERRASERVGESEGRSPSGRRRGAAASARHEATT
jgi:hypothetical protein